MSNAAITQKNKKKTVRQLIVLSINYPCFANFAIFLCDIKIAEKIKYFFASVCDSNIYTDSL